MNISRTIYSANCTCHSTEEVYKLIDSSTNVLSYNWLTAQKYANNIMNGNGGTQGVASVYRNTPNYSWNNPRNAEASSNKVSNENQTQETTDFMRSIKVGATDVQDALSALTSGTKVATSSDEDNLTANLVYGASKDIADTKIKIDQIATSQKNEGAAVKSTDAFSSPGTHEFEIELGDGSVKMFRVDVAASDTNEMVQQKMADAINGAKSGIKASVITENGQSRLEIESEKTGEYNKFTVRDCGDSTLVSDMGVGEATREAQNAQYRLNGSSEVLTSGSNEISLSNGVYVTLKGATSDDVTVSTKMDRGDMEKNVKELADGINKMLTAAYKDGGTGAQKLVDEIASTFQIYSSSLENIGISVGNDGLISVDSEKLSTAAENGTLTSFFTDTSKHANYGFVNKISNLADKVAGNPSAYASATTSSGSGSTTSSSLDSILNSGASESNSYYTELYNSYKATSGLGGNSGFLMDLFT